MIQVAWIFPGCGEDVPRKVDLGHFGKRGDLYSCHSDIRMPHPPEPRVLTHCLIWASRKPLPFSTKNVDNMFTSRKNPVFRPFLDTKTPL